MKEKNPMSSLFFGFGQAQPAGVLPARPPIMAGLAERIVVSRVVCPLFINFYFSFLSRPNRLCFGSPVRRFVLLFAFAERAVPLMPGHCLRWFCKQFACWLCCHRACRHAFG